MTLMRLFAGHEMRTQWRSTRFRALAAVYVILVSVPAVTLFLISGRTPRAIGPAAFNLFLLSEQPLLTALLAAGIAIDALSRERDEGSLAVLSVAPISSAGYVLRRWLAIVAVCIPVTLLPTVISAALAIHTRVTLPLLPFFADGWLVSVLPALLVSSALALALGTITGRAVLSIIFVAVFFTIGLDTLNDLLFHIHRLHFAGPGDLFAGGERSIDELMWAVRGFWFPDVPSDAAFPLRARSRALISRAGITTVMTIVLLAISTFYLRRTRRDLRPWKIAANHPLRTLIGVVNRFREEYAPDSGAGSADRVALIAGLILAALLTVSIVHEQTAFASLAAQRFAGETKEAVPTSTNIVAESVTIDGEINIDGSLRSRVTTVIRNNGDRAEQHLSFSLNPNVDVGSVTVGISREALWSARGAATALGGRTDRGEQPQQVVAGATALQSASRETGSVIARRVWERLDVHLDPPLAPHQSRTLSFDLAGTPAEVRFELQSPGDFRSQWTRYRDAKQSIYLTDISRSSLLPAATEVRMRLRASDIAPVLRYSPWVLQHDDRGEGFLPETIATNTTLALRLRHPYSIAVDSCGVVAASNEIVSGCTTTLASYLIFGGPLVQRPLGAAATLVFIPSHESLADAHAPSLASSTRLASDAWPQLSLPPHLVFIERPTEPGDRQWYNESMPWLTVEQIGARGAVFFVPEMLFTTRKPVNANVFAASIIAGTLRGKRRVIAEEAGFFTRFFTSVAVARLGMRKSTAVEKGAGFTAETAPLLSEYYRPESRMAKVLASLEYRAGSSHFVDGINDFVLRGGERAGTAKELVDAIGKAGGVDLNQTYDDYFAGRALPQLTLMNVTFHHAGQRWEVTGAVKNVNTGEAFVPIALRTSQGSLWQTIRVGSGGTTTFTFSAAGEPHALQLDPDHVCYRQAAIGLVENVEYRGQS
jgi:ABC-type transport system involved in multi-copper enzyme maturation permease subunit